MSIVTLDELARIVQRAKSEGKKTVLCHGCFDLMHLGHIKYFQAAKAMGDLLAVTVTPDIYVDKGPGRPVFSEDLRAEAIAALECVDYVAVNKWPTAEETLRLLRPDYYVKGQEFEHLQDRTGKINREWTVADEIGTEVRFTHEVVFSSTKILKSSGNHRVDDLLKRKILSLDELVSTTDSLKLQGKIIVQSHGVFDLIHPGVIAHLNSAREQGDLLVVTVIRDRDVRKGPGRPIFPEQMRLQNVASLGQVDFACLVDDGIPFECVKVVKPHVFAKSRTHNEKDRKIHGKIFKEERELYFGKSRIHETDGFSFSSSQIISNFLDIYPEETKSYLSKFSQKYTFNDILDQLNRLKNLKILLLGDGIIDEYHYCTALGRSAKSNLVVNKYLAHESFAGGAFAIANHIAGLCYRVKLVTLLGSEDSREEFIAGNLKQNVTSHFFYRGDGPTIVKKRYLDQYLNQKLFEVNYLNESYIDGDLEAEVIAYLASELPHYDLVLVSDFGHGFITGRIKGSIEKLSRKYAVNTQTNAANSGYNMITKYDSPYYVCLDEPEVRLAAQERYGHIEDVVRKIKRDLNAENLIVTLGKRGSIGINRENEIHRTPIFSTKVIDTIGAGDAFFAFTAPCLAESLPLDLVSFIGNAVGALAVQIVGNKKPVEKYELLEFIHAILR